MKRLLLIIVALIATSTALHAQMMLDARSMYIYNGSPKSFVGTLDNTVVGRIDFDEAGRITKLSTDDTYMTFTWRPDNTRITVKMYANGENIGVDYINIIEYTDSISHYEYGGYTIKITFNKWNRMTCIEMEQQGSIARQTNIYHNEKRDAAPCIIDMSANGMSMHQELIDMTLDSYENWIDVTMNINGTIMNQTREIEYY